MTTKHIKGKIQEKHIFSVVVAVVEEGVKNL